MQPLVVAIDAGRSATKVVYKTPVGSGRFMFPSAAMPARDLSDDAEAQRAAADTVRVNGARYWVGETAVVQRGPAAGVSLADDWIESEEHQVLLLSALKRLDAILAPKGIAPEASKLIVLGLPGRQFKLQRKRLESVAQTLEGWSQYEVKIVPQPKAPYNWYLQDDRGGLARGRSLEESYAVIDVGRYSTDLAVIVNGRFVEAALDSCDGMKGAAEKMLQFMNERGFRATITDAERAIAARSILFRGELVDLGPETKRATQSLRDEIMATVTRLVDPYSTTLNGIILAGGGSSIVYDVLTDGWKNVITETPNNQRFMVAEGMARWAAGILLVRGESAKTAVTR